MRTALLIALTLILQAGSASAQPSFSIVGVPNTVRVAETFTVDLVLDLGGYSSAGHQVSLSFTPGVLSVISVTELGSPPHEFNITPGVRLIDNVEGFVEPFEAASLGDGVNPVAPFAIGRITFRAEAAGRATVFAFFGPGGAVLDAGHPALPIDGVAFYFEDVRVKPLLLRRPKSRRVGP